MDSNLPWVSSIDKELLAQLGESDSAFLHRVYATPLEVYEHRLRAVNFAGLDCVLDAGCGFGQWAIALSKMNKKVCAVDIAYKRLRVAQEISRQMGINNIHYRRGFLEELPYDDGVFDAIFCYSSIFMTDYLGAMKEFARVLRIGGRLYLNTNGFGWYLYNLIQGRNSSADHNARIYALNTFIHSAIYYLTGHHLPSGSVIMTPKGTVRALEKNGFRISEVTHEGGINFQANNLKIVPNYAAKYAGFTNVFEVLAEKK